MSLSFCHHAHALSFWRPDTCKQTINVSMFWGTHNEHCRNKLSLWGQYKIFILEVLGTWFMQMKTWLYKQRGFWQTAYLHDQSSWDKMLIGPSAFRWKDIIQDFCFNCCVCEYGAMFFVFGLASCYVLWSSVSCVVSSVYSKKAKVLKPP